MSKKARALYDFEAQPGSGELSIFSGEILIVTRTDVGEGWWEGQNEKGEIGLFPEAYVSEVASDDEGPPSMAPPPLPPDYGHETPAMGWVKPAEAPSANTNQDDWGGWGNSPAVKVESNGASAGAPDPWDYPAEVTPKQNLSSTNQGYDPDDWDSDFDENEDQPTSTANSNIVPGSLAVPKNSMQSGSTGDLSSIGRSDSKKSSIAARTNFNRFSTFVKSGSENFVLGRVNANVQESDVISVIETGDGRYVWYNAQPPYSCVLASPKKESKLKGLKSYIAYQLTPSFNNIQVSRRYKHFDWLHERLVEKFTLIPVPPLPDKQIQGRYEDEFIEHRMNQLQSFVDRVSKHPILSQSEVWQHFLTCTDEKRWKTGKRKAEKDPLVGGNMFIAIRRPEKPLDPSFVDHQMDVFNRFSVCFDGAVKNVHKMTAEQTQKYQTHFKREFQNIGKVFLQLGQAIQQDGNMQSTNLNNAITITGEAYEDIAKMYEDQPKNDWEPLGDVMYDYKGILAGWPGILQIHSGATGKKKEFERLTAEGKSAKTETDEIGNRTDTLSYALMAEINNFHATKAVDIKIAHQKFLQEQIAFYQKITEKLQDALRMYDTC